MSRLCCILVSGMVIFLYLNMFIKEMNMTDAELCVILTTVAVMTVEIAMFCVIDLVREKIRFE